MIASPDKQKPIAGLAPLLARCDKPALMKVADAARLIFEDDSVKPAAKQCAFGAANILLDYDMDADATCAALLQAAVKPDTDAVTTKYGSEVAALLNAVLKALEISGLSYESVSSRHAERDEAAKLEGLRKMLLAMADDVRVVLVLLALQLQTMRDLSDKPVQEQHARARQSLDLFAPLANRLGIWQVKWEMEDLSFRYLEPDLYQKIINMLDEKRDEREKYIGTAVRILQRELDSESIAAQVSGRPKHIYSIYKKMQRKGLAFGDLYDIRAVRVLVENIKNCYAGLGIVHNLWEPLSGEFDDYIAHPKGNCYRSLHTAVVAEGKTLEVQIRTFDMHRDSELGIAAHWRYKESGTSKKSSVEEFDDKIAWMRQLLDWRNEVSTSGGIAKTGVFDDTVYVLSPQGRIVDLPKGATPLDFAYTIHTDLGHRCRGAKIDGVMVPLTTSLANGQRVEIIAAKAGGPSRDWLLPSCGYLHSTRALAKVRLWFKQQYFEQDVAQGRTILEKEMHRVGVHDAKLEKLALHFHLKTAEEFLAAIGRGEITPGQIDTALRAWSATAAPRETIPATRSGRAKTHTGGVLVLGVNNIATQFAKCCKPAPPEFIVGFVTKGRGVTVHRDDCRSIKNLKPEQRERLMPADWGDMGKGVFAVDIEIDAQERAGLQRDITEMLSREKIIVVAVATLARAGQLRLRLTVEILNLGQLNKVLKIIRTMPGVAYARRK
ncbi:MAG: bifunctional (p)ppGpp synthetase/guanosine-3',5'-bis(diphosphate) 3'-pyrophosphohydrolase [Burkholderiales bacterium]